MLESWKPVAGYEGLYEVSDRGRVKSFERKVFRKGHGYYTRKGRILKSGIHKGYEYVVLYRYPKKNTRFIHVLVARAFIAAHNGRVEVNHKDCDKRNNLKSNLEWVTHRDNMKHASKNKLLHPRRGELNHNCKLTPSDVLEIRRLKNTEKVKNRFIAKQFGIKPDTVYNISKYQSWKHI